MEDLLTMVGNVGFPIAVSIYLLIRVESKLGDLAKAIGELREAIITLPKETYWQLGASPQQPVPKSNGQSQYV